MKNIKYIIIALTLLGTAAVVYSKGASNEPRVKRLQLPENFKTLLVAEMRQIEYAMRDLIPLMARGELVEASKLADKIHNSFILKSSLSPNELKELIGLLPKDFITMDRAFHKNAKMLSEALKLCQTDRSTKIYGDMLNGCITCHTEYASGKFTGLVKLNKNKGN